MRRWTPRLTRLQMESTLAPLPPHLLNGFVGLTNLKFEYDHINSDFIMAILRHAYDWESIQSFMRGLRIMLSSTFRTVCGPQAELHS